MAKPLLALDFDGVLCDYHSGWQGPHKLGEPVAGAAEFVRQATMVFNVVVFSARARHDDAVPAMKAWLRRYGVPDVPITAIKPPAFLSIDDRAICFDGTFPDVAGLLKFKTWYE